MTLTAYTRPNLTADQCEGLDELTRPMGMQTNDVTADWRSHDDGSAADTPDAPCESVEWYHNADTGETRMTPADGFSLVVVQLERPLDGMSAVSASNSDTAKVNRRSFAQASGGNGSKVRNEMTPQLMSDGRWNVRTSARTADGSKVTVKRPTIHGWHALYVGTADRGATAAWLKTRPTVEPGESYGAKSHGVIPDGSGNNLRTVNALAAVVDGRHLRTVGVLTRYGKKDGRRGVKSDAGRPRRSQRRTAAARTVRTVRTESPQTIGRTVSVEVDAAAKAMLASESIG